MKNAVDPNLLIITAGAFRLGGFAEGTFLEIDRSLDAFTEVVGADGELARAFQRNRMAVITLTLLQSSSSNNVLDTFRLADEVARAGVFPFMAKDLNAGASIVFSSKTYVRKVAKQAWSQNVETRVWTLVGADVDVLLQGSADA